MYNDRKAYHVDRSGNGKVQRQPERVGDSRTRHDGEAVVSPGIEERIQQVGVVIYTLPDSATSQHQQHNRYLSFSDTLVQRQADTSQTDRRTARVSRGP